MSAAVDDAGVLASIGNGDLVITGPNGFMAVATLVSKAFVAGTANAAATATYQIFLIAHPWTSMDNGDYEVEVESGEVLDARGNAAAAGTIGGFTVLV